MIGTAAGPDADYVRGIGAEKVIDYSNHRFEEGGILVSVVSPKPQEANRPNGVRMAFFIVDVTTARLDRLTTLFDSHALKAQVGSVLSLERARIAHKMLAGAPHNRGRDSA